MKVTEPAVLAHVMIVDDEPENLNVLAAALSQDEYRVSVFPSGERALEAARKEAPDLLLLDVRMPGLDGYEVCRLFKADERLCAVPVLFISALSATEEIAAGFACGGVDYITKPFREPEVLARVRTHLALRDAYARLEGRHDQLRRLERHRDSLVHMLVHDMRSPLQVILGHLQLLEKTEGLQRLPADDQDNLYAAIHGTRLLGRMVDATLDLNRLESEEIPLTRVTASASEIFYTALAQTVDPSSARTITDQIAYPCPPVRCDVGVTVRIVSNLIANALKYTPAGCEIVFGAAPDPAGVRFWVRDRGPGIAAGDQAIIFAKFGVAGDPVSRQSSSTGLGLAFCKLAAEAQGGAIGVESEPGAGSTFWFTLPAAGE